MTRFILAIQSDEHGGHKLGLCNPEIVLHDEDEEGNVVPFTPKLTAVQEYLWDLQLSHIRSVMEIADGYPIYLIKNGDPIHGSKHPEQQMSTRASDQIIIGVKNCEPWLALPNLKHIRMTFSTGSHAFGEGTADVLIAEYLRKERDDIDVRTYYHGLAHAGDVAIDFTHHGPGPGIREWTRGNVARYYLRSLVMSCIVNDLEVPDLVVRSHFHQPIEEDVYLWRLNQMEQYKIIVTPSYCGLGDYAKKVTRSAFILRNGLFCAVVENGKIVRSEWFVETKDLRTRETV